MTSEDQNKTLLELTAQIVAAHVAKNQVASQGLPGLIEQVYTALKTAGAAPAAAPAEKPLPFVPAKRSIFPDYIICLEDGRKLKTLKRHLRSTFGLSPEQYREKWGLPPDYPMVAPNYAQHRSKLAKQLGLGRKPVADEDEEEADRAEVSAAPEMPEPPPAPPGPPALGADSGHGVFAFSGPPEGRGGGGRAGGRGNGDEEARQKAVLQATRPQHAAVKRPRTGATESVFGSFIRRGDAPLAFFAMFAGRVVEIVRLMCTEKVEFNLCDSLLRETAKGISIFEPGRRFLI